MTHETEKPNAPDQSAQEKRKTARELYLDKIAINPRWLDTTMAGRSFIIGGVRPPQKSER
jgi:hypothetical protein